MQARTRVRLTAVKMSRWVKRGPSLVRRDALDLDDPDHPSNWFAANFPGVNSWEFGIAQPFERIIPHAD